MTNEGDFMRIANTLGAKLGNLHNVWRNEGLFEQAVASPTAYNCVWFYNGDSFLMVNRDGRRFVNEKRNYQDRSMAHLEWDANYAQWKNLISVLVYDGRIQENWGDRLPVPGRSGHRSGRDPGRHAGGTRGPRSPSGSRRCARSLVA